VSLRGLQLMAAGVLTAGSHVLPRSRRE
jgi:hypothetical protein